MRLYYLLAFIFIGVRLFGQTDSITPYPSPGVLDGVYTPEYKHGKSIIYHKPSTMAVWERTDTNFFENGRIESITELNAFGQRIGVNKEFDSTGVLRIEGEYTQMDSSKCLNCYEGYFGDDTLGSWHKIDKINVREVKVGNWLTYHANGKVSTSGQYDTLFCIYYGSIVPKIEGPSPVGLKLEQLKFGIWKYYNETGKLYRKEEYYQGTLVYQLYFE